MRTFVLCIVLGMMATALDASSVKPIKGVDVIVQKKPGNTLRLTTNDDGNVPFPSLEPGTYTLLINPCAERHDGSQPNQLVAFLVSNPGVSMAHLHLAGMTCAVSQAAPLRGQRLTNGTLDVAADVPLDVLAAGVEIELTVGTGASLQCQLGIQGSQ